MKRILACIVSVLVFSSCAYADSETFDIAGRWLMKGVGHVDKSFVRSSLALEGYMNIQTSGISQDVQMIESYDAYLRIDATTLGIKVYDEHIENGIKISAPVPTRIPTESYPIELPSVTYDGLTYSVKITGSNSGTVTIQGVIKDVDIIGDLELDSDCKIWRAGTPEPEIDEGKSSGCDSGFGMMTLALMMMLLGGSKHVRN